MRAKLQGFLGKLRLQRKITPGSRLAYWEKRHKKYGARSIVNLAHSEEQLEAVTQMQRDRLFPLLSEELNGNEELILDFGCGPGRFTSNLAEIIQGRAVGIDPSKHLISLAPRNDSVEYRQMDAGVIPMEDASADVVWVCLVLSVIVDEPVYRQTVDEIHRVAKSDSLLFLVANTADREDLSYIKYRSLEDYQEAFSSFNLRQISEYHDLDERVSIMAGRRQAS
jgi:ubiquinone/menaquinone biosynthesis C-methylase UbiE